MNESMWVMPSSMPMAPKSALIRNLETVNDENFDASYHYNYYKNHYYQPLNVLSNSIPIIDVSRPIFEIPSLATRALEMLKSPRNRMSPNEQQQPQLHNNINYVHNNTNVSSSSSKLITNNIMTNGNHMMTTCNNKMMENIGEKGKVIDEEMMEEYCRVITPENKLKEESEEVCFRILECLAMRDKWLFKISEERRPENRRDLREAACTSEIYGYDAFTYVDLPVSNIYYELEKGLFHVYDDESKSLERFPLPGTAYEFFKDMHYILKVSKTYEL